MFLKNSLHNLYVLSYLPDILNTILADQSGYKNLPIINGKTDLG